MRWASNATFTVLEIFWTFFRIIVYWVALISLATASNMKMCLSLAYSLAVAAARQQTELRHPAGDSCKCTDQIDLVSDVASLTMKSDRGGVKGTQMIHELIVKVLQ